MKIKLVQNDTRPQINIALTDETDGSPLDISAALVKMNFRQVGHAAIKETLTLGLLPGIVLDDGTIDTTAPYNVPGKGGRCYVAWSPASLDTVGDFQGEIFITFTDGGVQTVYDTLKFKVRDDF